MAKLKGKGTVLQQTIASVLTDVAQVIDINIDGEESEEYDSRTLDTAVYLTKELTGFTEPGTVSANLFFDPALAGHQAIVALLTTPAACVWKVKYSDAGPSSLTYTSAKIGLSQTIVGNDGLKAALTMSRTGAPTRA
jgi:hypothetical protein